MSKVLFEKNGHIGIIRFNSPNTLNALSSDYINEINDVLDRVEQDLEIYTLIFTGSGKAFIAGADISEMYPMNEEEIFAWSAYGSDLNLRIEKLNIPTIAAINGYALGGGMELALSCDIRIASKKAKMGFPETGLAVICGAGGTQRLPRIVGSAKAKELLFTAKVIDAEEAFQIGLINHIVSGEDLMNEVMAMAKSIEKNGPIAVKTAKKAVRYSEVSDIENGCLLERKLFSTLFNTEDQKIAMKGFLNKEKNIKFKNR